MFTAEKITNAFAKVYHEKVVPRTQQAAIDKYKEENPPVITVVTEEKVNVEEPTIPQHQERLAKLSPSAMSLDGYANEHQLGLLRSISRLTFSSRSLRFRLAQLRKT